jgi:hypothetical protein
VLSDLLRFALFFCLLRAVAWALKALPCNYWFVVLPDI